MKSSNQVTIGKLKNLQIERFLISSITLEISFEIEVGHNSLILLVGSNNVIICSETFVC